MYAEERQQAIAGLVRDQGRQSVADIATRFDVTAETVRRDLSALERFGLLRRVHGGAVAVEALGVLEAAVRDRDRKNAPQKERIAAAAAAYVTDGDCILLDAGTTTSRMAPLLKEMAHLSVVTHALPVAARLAGYGGVKLRLLPGSVRPETQAAVGEDTVDALCRLKVDVAVLGTNGISVGHGLSTPDYSEAAVKRAIVKAGRRVVVLADADKLGEETLVRFADLADVDVLVTDSRATPEQLAPLEAAGMKIVVA
jgi:DeoR family fructose operon transcriptional repressor